METIKLDLIPGKKMPSLHASQYDDGRDYHIDLTENRVPYTLDGTETISLTVRKCDNTLVTMDIANTFADKSYIEFRTTEQMNACAGFNYGEITIEKNGTQISSLNVYFVVEEAPDEGGVQSQSEINNLNRQIKDYLDEALPDVLDDDVPPIVERVIDETLAPVAKSGNYNDLENKPSIPAAQVNSDWNADSGVSQILNKPNLATVATTGDYNDLLNKPSVAVIDDTQASASKVYSSNKVDAIANTKASSAELDYVDSVKADVVTIFLNNNFKMIDWEIGSIDRGTGADRVQASAIRTKKYHKLECSSVTLTAESTYTFATRAYYIQNNSFVYDQSKSIQFFTAGTQTFTPELNYYYRFLISNTSGADATVDYASRVTISTKPLYDIAKLPDVTSVTMLSPLFEVVDLPEEITYFQSFEKVDDEIWFLRESTGGNTNGIIYRIDATTFAYIGQIAHNFGHINNISYDEASDRLICSTGMDLPTDGKHAFYIFENVSAWKNEATLNMSQLTYEEIDFSELKNLYGTLRYSDACWGYTYENNLTCWITSNGLKEFYNIVLGVGDDVKAYGTYKANAGINGTFDLIGSYQNKQDAVLSEMVCQSLKVHNGKLFTSIGHSILVGGLWEMKYNGSANLSAIKELLSDSSGTNEGASVIDGVAYLGITNGAHSKIVRLYI